MPRQLPRPAGPKTGMAAMLVAGLAVAGPGMAAEVPAGQLAVDRGCYNCHAEPSRKNVRSFAEIRGSYARLRDRPDAQAQAVDRMRRGSLFSHVAAHERLSDEEAAALVRWLFTDGA